LADFGASNVVVKESLFGIMPVQEISSLVGWATHHTHDGTVPVTENVVEQSTNEETATDSLPLNNGTNDQQAIRIRTENLSRPDGQETNPLLFLPNTPLPPSHLRYLTEKAREYVEEPMQYNDVWESHTFLASSDSSGDEKAFKTKYKPKDWQQWEYDAEDETYLATKELLKKRRRLLTVHVPCPISKCDRRTNKGPRKRTASVKKSFLYKSFDDSALIALGIAWEEMITASLLPLARQHVERCRRLEHNIAIKSTDMLGYGTALKILFMNESRLATSLERNEIVAFINTVARFSESMREIRELTNMYWENKEAPPPPTVTPLPVDSTIESVDLVDTAVGLVASLA
jgi:hypothetical protein